MEHSGARIVLLDNDARIVELVEWFLGSRGFVVRTASSFAGLRERLAEGPCDLLISDLDLGAESALTELPRLAAERALPPTLVVSGFLDATNQRSVMEVPGVVGTLPKPFEFEDLEARVRECLGAAPAVLQENWVTRGRVTPRRSAGDLDPAVVVVLARIGSYLWPRRGAR